MKITFLLSVLMSIGLADSALAQSNQSPTMQQSTSTSDTRKTNPVKPRLKKMSRQEQTNMERGLDTTLPKNRRQRRLAPDSLRRGGATRVDTIR